LGLAMLPVALIGAWFSPAFAFGVSLYAGIAFLVLPFLVAVPLQRNLIGHRRLSLVPRLPLYSGLVLLALAVAGAGFIPLAGQLLGIEQATLLLALHLFNVGSLYAGIMQYSLTSRFAPLLMSLMPFVIFLLVIPSIRSLQHTQLVVPFTYGLFCLSLAGWAWALWRLARRTHFHPLYRHCNGSEFSNLFTMRLADPTPTADSAAATLLLAFPASWPARLLTLGYFLLLGPLLFSVTILVLSRPGAGPNGPGFFGLLLFCSLLSLISFPASFAQLPPRLRLLWLRRAGSRRLAPGTVALHGTADLEHLSGDVRPRHHALRSYRDNRAPASPGLAVTGVHAGKRRAQRLFGAAAGFARRFQVGQGHDHVRGHAVARRCGRPGVCSARVLAADPGGDTGPGTDPVLSPPAVPWHAEGLGRAGSGGMNQELAQNTPHGSIARMAV
ncbi:MAG TPA: hypothetical protein VNR18_11555, partial [Hyphomicrobiales bacterium]|nr:hypothetical protein [Hyphomicrobiales bacterium]